MGWIVTTTSKWLWEQFWHLKIGWKRTRVTGARCPDSEYFSGGLGIHSLGARFSRVGAPDMNSFSASVSLASSSLTWNKGKLLLDLIKAFCVPAEIREKGINLFQNVHSWLLVVKIRLQTQIVSFVIVDLTDSRKMISF
jgi:hypothetical protein